MKGKLIKLNVGVGYRLDDEHGNLFASTLQSSKTKLSIQNCDEIFGAIDVEKLAEEEIPYSSSTTLNVQRMRFIHGFNKAMELNKNKLFTLDDMREAIAESWNSCEDNEDGETFTQCFNRIIQSLQQPKEIEVEIVMDKIPADLAPGGWDVFPKLDSQGCLILKRVV
jgi:hypothetical protein